MGSAAAKKIFVEKSKFDVNITIRNLKEEAKDDSEDSGASDVSDQKSPKNYEKCQIVSYYPVKGDDEESGVSPI